ncbi:hypothetical protein [uncultured Aquabacterium sp.]|uniref:lipopolysaccharide biosynthesis protein n=1 Tax=uncultured Aquabacterium sp. TaxID=158753 RepID=UPI002633808F|nr:hypothetical protein [uncultured Aquabacterium sp.]
MSARNRIIAGLGAHAFGQLVTIFGQIALTPLYFKSWGAAMYGEWLMLSTIPAYLVMADLGIGSAAGNDMAMKVAAGDKEGARSVLRAMLYISACAAAAVIAVGVFAGGLIWSIPFLHTSQIPVREASAATALLGVGVGVGFFSSVASGVYRAVGRNAAGVLIANLARMVEISALGILLLLGAGPIDLCLCGLFIRTASLIIQRWHIGRISQWLILPGAKRERGAVRRLLRPALGFMAYPLGNALALQGPLMLIGVVMGPASSATFAALRTVARVPNQITNVLSFSIWPEISKAYGESDESMLREMHRASWGITAIVAMVAATILCIFGPMMAEIWLHRAISVDRSLLAGLLLIATTSSLWNASAVFLSAVNLHAKFGLLYVVTNSVGLILAGLLASLSGWLGLLTSLWLVEVVLLVCALLSVLNLTRDYLWDFILALPSTALKRASMGVVLKRKKT